MIGAASIARNRLNAQIESPFELADMEQAMMQLAEALGEEERDRLMAEGAHMSADEAVELALA